MQQALGSVAQGYKSLILRVQRCILCRKAVFLVEINPHNLRFLFFAVDLLQHEILVDVTEMEREFLQEHLADSL